MLLKLILFKPINNRANVEVEPGVEKDEDSLENDKQDVEGADTDSECGVARVAWVAIQWDIKLFRFIFQSPFQFILLT